MEHLTRETLARLVDDVPAAHEARHLKACDRCRKELEALRGQTVGLAQLPHLRPPRTGWAELEERLRGEGLLQPADPPRAHPPPGDAALPKGGAEPEESGTRFEARLRRLGRKGPAWRRAAAAAALLLAGAGAGYGIGALGGPAAGTDEAPFAADGGVPSEFFAAAADPDSPEPGLTLAEAEELVRVTEEWYRTALLAYRERLRAEEGWREEEPNPLTRFAAIEAVMAASRAAVREAPTDPFLNGLLVNMQAEREATLRGIRASAPGENWY